MPYRIAGIDVHKKMLAVVVSDVEVDGEYHFERRQFGSNPEQLRLLAAWLLEQEAEEVVGGIHGAILEISLGGTGALLEADPREAGGRKPDVWNVASGVGAVQSGTARTQEGFPRCRTFGEATGGQ